MRIKFLCSFGGKISGGPSDGNLVYVGGTTRVIRISNDTSWQQLREKTMALYKQPHTIKYQLQGEDLDVLVSVHCDEDLKHMLRFGVVGGSTGSEKLFRLFLFAGDSIWPSVEVQQSNASSASADGENEESAIEKAGGVAGSLCGIVLSDMLSAEDMKVICNELTQATSDPESSSMEEFVKEADGLVSCLAAMLPKTFDINLHGDSPRSCKYVLNTLMQIFQNKQLAHAVKESTLENLITEILIWLLDERLPTMDDGSQLLKALNVLMLKILDNAERTLAFVVLINLLKPLDSSRWPSPLSNDTFISSNEKFSDLVVKCLIKITKVLQNTIDDVNLDHVLQSIHLYMEELGMEEIRRRAGADDKPLRMVKTILHELVRLRGTAIKGSLSMVPIDMQPKSIILAYIDLNLETLAAVLPQNSRSIG